LFKWLKTLSFEISSRIKQSTLYLPVNTTEDKYNDEHISNDELYLMRMKSPYARKIISKYNEIFTDFEIDTDNESFKKYAEEFNNFLKDIKAKKYLRILNTDAITFGTGYLEIVFDDDRDVDEPVESFTYFALIDSIDRVNRELEVHKPKDSSDDFKGYDIIDSNLVKKKKIHKDRVLVSDVFEKSRILETVYHACLAADRGLKSIKDIMHRYSLPFYDITVFRVSGGDEIEKISKAVRKAMGETDFVHTDRFKVEPKGFGGMNIPFKDIYDVLLDAISAGSGIPKTLLVGSGQGTISTSETNLKDWFNTILPIQDYYEDEIILGRLFELYCQMKGYDYSKIRPELYVVWADLIPEDKERKAKIRKTHAEADALYIDRGIPIEVINRDRQREGLEPLEIEEE